MDIKAFAEAMKQLDRLPEEALRLTAVDFAKRMPAQVSKAVRKKYNVSTKSMKSAGVHATSSALKGSKNGKDFGNMPFEYTLNEISYSGFRNAVSPKEPPESRTGSVVFPQTVGAVKWAKAHGLSAPAFRTPKRYKVKAKVRKGAAETIGDKNGHAPFVKRTKRGTDIFYSKVVGDRSVREKAKSGLSFDSIIKDPDVFPDIQKSAGELFEKRFEHQLAQAEKKVGKMKNIIVG